jgi:RNA-directed DNA polymerase
MAQELNPILQGWLNYHGRYSAAAMRSVWKHVNAALIAWAMRKYRRYAGRKMQAGQMIGSIADKRRRLFVHWHQSPVGAFA